MEDHLKFWMIVAEYFQNRASEQTLRLYAKDTEQIPLESLQKAFRIYRSNPVCWKMPLPSTLISLLELGSTRETAADELARKLFALVAEKGWVWPLDEEYLSDFLVKLGPFGLEVTNRFGGWEKFCEQANKVDPAIFHAQLKKTCAAVIEVKSIAKEALPPGKILGQLVHGTFGPGNPPNPSDPGGSEKS